MSSNLLNIFDKLCYGKQPVNVFNDLLTVTIAQFCPKPHYQSEHSEAVNRLSKKELINEFVYSLVGEYHLGIEHKGWCDPWGDLYMDLSSHYKAQAMGQYFTPVDICTMMTKMTSGADESITGKRFSDPACGSGRMLLATKSLLPNNFFFGEDLDSICCKMAVVNFAFHGCIGEVVQHNTLTDPKGCIQGWKIADVGYSVPAIIPITKEQSYICSGVNWFDAYSGIDALLKTITSVNSLSKQDAQESDREGQVSKAPVFDKVIEVEQMELSLF